MIKKGSLLENVIRLIYKQSGFAVQNNVIIKGYEIDVLATFENKTIIIECKQYENSGSALKNLIHQWKSKNDIIGADKVVIAFYGEQPSKSDYELAKVLGIELWDTDHIITMLEKSFQRKSVREELLGVIRTTSLFTFMKVIFVIGFIGTLIHLYLTKPYVAIGLIIVIVSIYTLTSKPKKK